MADFNRTTLGNFDTVEPLWVIGATDRGWHCQPFTKMQHITHTPYGTAWTDIVIAIAIGIAISALANKVIWPGHKKLSLSVAQETELAICLPGWLVTCLVACHSVALTGTQWIV